MRHGNGSARRGRRTCRLAVPLVLAVACPSVAFAGGPAVDELSDGDIQLAGALPDNELDGLRGGFAIGPYEIAFGIELRSTLDDMMQFVSRLNVNERAGNQAVGTLTSWVQTMTEATAGMGMPAVNIQTSPGAVTFGWGQSGSGSEVEHNFANGLLSIIRNVNNNANLGSHVTVNVDMQNASSIMAGMQARSHAMRFASEAARFRPSR